MRCALVSSRLDLRGYLGTQFADIADCIEMVDHRRHAKDEDIRMAIAWHPPDDAFEHYPNLQAVCSIGAGVDSIIACPSLRPGIDVVRVVDPAQAQMMSGFVAWHAIWHQRRFRTYLDRQRAGICERLEQRAAHSVPVAILGFAGLSPAASSMIAFTRA